MIKIKELNIESSMEKMQKEILERQQEHPCYSVDDVLDLIKNKYIEDNEICMQALFMKTVLEMDEGFDKMIKTVMGNLIKDIKGQSMRHVIRVEDIVKTIKDYAENFSNKDGSMKGCQD